MRSSVKIGSLALIILTLISLLSAKSFSRQSVRYNTLSCNTHKGYPIRLNSEKSPENYVTLMLFHNGIDESDINISEHFHYYQGYYISIFIPDKMLDYSGWCNCRPLNFVRLPGYQCFLASLPLRSPPFYC